MTLKFERLDRWLTGRIKLNSSRKKVVNYYLNIDQVQVISNIIRLSYGVFVPQYESETAFRQLGIDLGEFCLSEKGTVGPECVYVCYLTRFFKLRLQDPLIFGAMTPSDVNSATAIFEHMVGGVSAGTWNSEERRILLKRKPFYQQQKRDGLPPALHALLDRVSSVMPV